MSTRKDRLTIEYENAQGELKRMVVALPEGATPLDYVVGSVNYWILCSHPDGSQRWHTTPLPADRPGDTHILLDIKGKKYAVAVPDDFLTLHKGKYWPKEGLIELRYKSIPGPKRIFKTRDIREVDA